MTPTSPSCFGYPITNNSQPDCFELDTGLLIQSALNQQAQLIIDNYEITIAGTLYLDSSTNEKFIAILEGSAIIGTDNIIKTLNKGQQITLNPSKIEQQSNYDIASMSILPLDQLQRDVIIPTVTPTPIIIPTETPVCPRPTDWTQVYQVQSGDNLTKIADRADVTLEDLQSYNCLENPNNITVGITLFLPEGSIAPTQPSVTFTPSAVFFRADRETLTAGNCTILRWDVQNIRNLLLDGTDVMNQTNQQVCPTETTTYTLKVIYFDETQTEHQVTIRITP